MSVFVLESLSVQLSRNLCFFFIFVRVFQTTDAEYRVLLLMAHGRYLEHHDLHGIQPEGGTGGIESA